MASAKREAEAVDATSLQKAVHGSAAYLVGHIDSRGQFVYRVNMNPDVRVKPRYNMLRHAGTMYALAMYARRHPERSDAVRDVLVRASGFLKHASLGGVAGHADMLAIWSRPTLTHNNKDGLQAKLGGTGLGLVALLSVEQVLPGTTELDVLRKMGRFLCFMQNDDGSFYSKFFPDARGRQGEWGSLYYPGEAALGLLMLHERDPSGPWLDAATRAISYLARKRAPQETVVADHWVLLATAELLVKHREPSAAERDKMVRHAVQICEGILSGVPRVSPEPGIRGVLTNSAMTCKTSTRLEGLLASLTFLPAEHEQLRERIASVVHDAVRFLVRTQVREGRYAGGMPRAMGMSASDGDVPDGTGTRVTEIRIDYVQHAMCAMMEYERLGLESSLTGVSEGEE